MCYNSFMDTKNFLLVGSESYNLKARRDQIIASVVNEESEDVSYSLYRGIDKADIRDVIEDCEMASLFGQKVVVYENPLFLNEKEKSDDKEPGKNSEVNLLVQYLKDPNPDTTFILYLEGSVSQRSKIVKELCKYMKYEHYDVLKEDEFQNLVNRDLINANIKLDYRARQALFARLPLSVENWKQEYEKLKLYPGKIDEEVILNLISKPLEDNAFELSNAVVDKNLSKAISVFRDLMVNNKNDIPSLIGLLANQFRTMSQVKIMDDLNMDYLDIAAAIGSKSDYRVKMVLKAIGQASSRELLKLLSDLSDLDQKIKTGQIDPQTGLELFIIQAVNR